MKPGSKQIHKINIAAFCCAAFFCGHIMAQEKKYYVAASGRDNNNGYTPQTAWRSIEKLNSIDLKPGDSVLFEGGSIFSGTVKLTSGDNGAAGKPVVLTSYGKGKATINGGDGDGLLAVNTSFVKLLSLNFEGSGVNTNKGSGIHFFANDTINAPSDVEITGCLAKGFSASGFVFGANDNIAYKGYRHVRITHCDATGNGNAGFSSFGSQFGYQHRDFYLAYCRAFGNRGILSKTQSHSGNGIVMAMVDSIVIEHSEAFENGADNRCEAGGPVGIWGVDVQKRDHSTLHFS